MSDMTDPMNALVSLQAALDQGLIATHQCELYPRLRVIADQPGDMPRYTYANIRGGKVQSISVFALTEPIGGLPCFQIGYAVVESMRQRGLASDIVEKGIQELRNGLRQHGAGKFYVEAIVGVSNILSNRLARRLLSDTPESINDVYSGQPALRYLRLVEL